MPYYYDPNEKNPKPIHLNYSNDETKRIFEFAEWFAGRCELSEWPIRGGRVTQTLSGPCWKGLNSLRSSG